MRFDSLYEINLSAISIYSSNYALNSSLWALSHLNIIKNPHFNLSPQTILSPRFTRELGLTAISS